MDDELHQTFIDSFNSEIEKLGCGVRVQAVADDSDAMEIVDLDGRSMGRVVADIEPEAFASMMLIVEQAYEDGVRDGRRAASPTITLQ